jgi:hypothetical protein
MLSITTQPRASTRRSFPAGRAVSRLVEAFSGFVAEAENLLKQLPMEEGNQFTSPVSGGKSQNSFGNTQER